MKKNQFFVVSLNGRSGFYSTDEEGKIFASKTPENFSAEFLIECQEIEIFEESNEFHFLALNDRFNFYCDNRLLGSNVTSICLHNEFVLLTTIKHVLLCIPRSEIISSKLLSQV